MLLTATVIALFAGWVAALWPYYHVFGTDQTGNDVLFQAIKSIRTAVVIGSLATIATLPFAIAFGILAGYYKGRVDDAIQYVYTVLSSIPSVLLIAAFVLMIQVFIDKNPQLFDTGLERADIRLFLLAAILGITGWAGLARLLRAETLKLGELDYVQAARAFGVSDAGIMRRHILPNVTHIVVIVAVLDFSGLVLYEAVLSYVGVGVDPTTNSFGTMINSARNEMSRDPVVWWTLLAAFAFMVTLVLSMTLFASAVREAFDPRARAFRVRRAKPAPATRRRPGRHRSGRGHIGNGMLDIENLTTELDSDNGLVRAVDALTLTIARGETFALVGESGCGKSMTALSILRLLPDSGRVSGGSVDIDGIDITQLPEAQMRDVRGRRISIIFQEPSTSLNPVMTVGRQITEVIERHTAVRGDAAVAKARRLAEARRHPRPRTARQRLSVPDVGRPEAARDDRHRARRRAGRRDRRRTHHRARRHDPGADPRPAEGVAALAEDGDAADHARPGHRRADGASRGADVCGTGRRSGRGQGILRRSAASLRGQPVRGAARHRQARPQARVDRRVGAAAEPGVHRLPLCRPLRRRDGPLPRRAAAADRIPPRAPGALRAVRRRRRVRRRRPVSGARIPCCPSTRPKATRCWRCATTRSGFPFARAC